MNVDIAFASRGSGVQIPSAPLKIITNAQAAGLGVRRLRVCDSLVFGSTARQRACVCNHGQVIESAEEFVRLRSSDDPADYRQAASDAASVETWLDVVDRFPDMRVWVAHNKTVPPEVLEVLRHDPDERVRGMVLEKRSWARAYPDDTARVRGLENTRSANWKREASGLGHECGIVLAPSCVQPCPVAPNRDYFRRWRPRTQDPY